MSLVSIVKNEDIIKEKLNYILGKDIRIVLRECLEAQYDMMRENLNSNMIKKRYFNSNISGKELLNALYQHIYSHNHIALTDEIFETLDANNIKNEKYLKCEDTELAELLIAEEIIDTFHFILEYTILLEEHYLLTLENPDKITVDNLPFYYIHKNSFWKGVLAMLYKESNHILHYINENGEVEINKIIANSDYFLLINFLKEMLKNNRDFIRLCNFKDWKHYPDNYYSPYLFGELFKINREMYVNCVNALSFTFNSLIKYLDVDIEYSTENILKLMYAVYMATREENIRRQNNDPRYTGKNEGEVVGVNVN